MSCQGSDPRILDFGSVVRIIPKAITRVRQSSPTLKNSRRRMLVGSAKNAINVIDLRGLRGLAWTARRVYLTLRFCHGWWFRHPIGPNPFVHPPIQPVVMHVVLGSLRRVGVIRHGRDRGCSHRARIVHEEAKRRKYFATRIKDRNRGRSNFRRSDTKGKWLISRDERLPDGSSSASSDADDNVTSSALACLDDVTEFSVRSVPGDHLERRAHLVPRTLTAGTRWNRRNVMLCGIQDTSCLSPILEKNM